LRIVEPSAQLMFITPNAAQMIEHAGRCCYKSEDKITDDSADKFVQMIDKRGHHSVIEHAYATFRIVTDRGITHEIVRHRLASYSQECVSGDTLVTKNHTLKSLFERSKNQYGVTHNKTLRLRSVSDDMRILPNKIVRVLHKGRAKLFRLRTKLGYEIKVTRNHEFLRTGGQYTRLAELSPGEKVMVNGRPCLLKIDDQTLRADYLKRKLTPQEIADEHGAPYRSVLLRLKNMGIFEKHCNDKNKEKYRRNHTQKSRDRMRRTVLRQYREGRSPWNAGLSEEESPSVKRQADALRAKHHNNPLGKRNSNWKGGISQSYYSRKVSSGPCALCGDVDAPEIHHKDENRRNNSRSNLIRICVNCHNKLHHGWHVGTKAHADEIESIEFCGAEDVYDLEMEAPNHNYVANGFVVHNSSRYCNYGKNKFGSELTMLPPSGMSDREQEVWQRSALQAEQNYMDMLEAGAPPERARSVLLTCQKTEIVMTANFREWLHFLKLRTSEKAHPDMRTIANMIGTTLAEHCPSVFGEYAA